MEEPKCKSMAEIQQLVEAAICERTRADIVNILERISSLKPPERLLLYMRMPSGAPETDPLRQPQNPLGTRSEINHTINWVRSHLEHDSNVSIPKQDVYDDYFSYCTRISIKPLSTADFGKVMKQVFPTIRPRRLGTRGNSRYCYAALRKTTRLTVPTITLAGSSAPSVGPDLESEHQQNEATVSRSTEEDRIIRDWASKVLHVDFSSTKELAEYITANQLVQTNSRNARLRPASNKPCPKERSAVVEADDLSSVNLTKKRRKKTPRNSVSTETSRAASPVSEPHPSTAVTIKQEPDTQKGAQFPPQNQMLLNPYANVVNNSVIMSPMNTRPMKTELVDVDLEEAPPINQMHNSKPDVNQSQSHILCKKVRQAQQTKELYAQRALNLDTNPADDETSLMRPPINNPQTRFADNMAKRSLSNNSSQLSSGEKGGADVSTDIIIPRERVISICSLEKDALDDYLNGGDNSQDQEVELLKYFQSDENAQNMSIDTKPVPMLENYQLSNDGDYSKIGKRIGYDKNISELRYYLQQNLQQSSESAGSRGQAQPINREVIQGFASATLNKMSINCRAVYQPKRESSSAVTSPCFLPENAQLENMSESNLTQPTNNNNNNNGNIPQSPNSRRKNFTFVPISPGSESPSGAQLNICGNQLASAPTKQTPFVSPKSASHRKIFKQTASNSSFPNQTQIANHPYITSQSTVYGRNNNIACSAPPSPSPILQMRHDQQTNPMQLADQAKKLQYDGSASDMFGIRSQSAPLHCQMQNGKPQMFGNTSSISLSQSPIPNEYCEFMDIVGSNERLVKIEPPSGATDLSTATSDSTVMRINNHINNHNLPVLCMPNQEPHQFIGSRSVPSTPQPLRFFGTTTPATTTSASMNMYDISKSVPTTPLANGFCGAATPFRYSPSELNRDFLINGNTVEPMCGNSMTSTFFSSGQHSLDHTDQQNSNLSERDLRTVAEDIDELSSFGDAADPIIGSDLLNQL